MFLVLLSFKSLLKSLFIVVFFFLEFSYSLVNPVILSFIMVLLLSIFFVFFAHFYIELFTLKISLWQLFETYFGHQSMMCFPHTKPQINFFKIIFCLAAQNVQKIELPRAWFCAVVINTVHTFKHKSIALHFCQYFLFSLLHLGTLHVRFYLTRICFCVYDVRR